MKVTMINTNEVKDLTYIAYGDDKILDLIRGWLVERDSVDKVKSALRNITTQFVAVDGTVYTTEDYFQDWNNTTELLTKINTVMADCRKLGVSEIYLHLAKERMGSYRGERFGTIYNNGILQEVLDNLIQGRDYAKQKNA